MTLPSGLTVVHEYLPTSPVVAYQLWVNRGSANETDDIAGSAHFLEHMLFKGSQKLDAQQFSFEVEGLGGNINAFTTYDQTAFHLTLSSSHWKRGLEVFLDLVFHPRLEEEDMETERKVILEEFLEGEDAIETSLSEEFFRSIYRNHSYGRPVIGNEASVRGLTHEQLLSLYERWYHPGNMTLAVAGNIDWHLLQDALSEFHDHDSREQEVSILTSPSMEEGLIYVTSQKGDAEEILELSFPIPGVMHEDIAALDLLSVIFGDGERSRLYESLYEKKGIVRSIGTYLFTPKLGGHLFISAYPMGVSVLKLLEAICEEVYLLCSKGVSSQEVLRAKLQLDKDLTFAEETTEGRAKTLAFYESVFGDYSKEELYRKALYSVTASDVQRVANRYMNQGRMGVAILLPKTKEVPSEQTVKEVINRGFQIKGNRLPRSSSPMQEVSLALDQGVLLTLRRLEDMRVACIHALFEGGSRRENLHHQGISNLIASTLDQGTVRRNAEEISEALIYLQADLHGLSGRDSNGLRMDLVSHQVEDGLTLFHDVLLEPSFPNEFVEKDVQAALFELEAQKDYFDVEASILFQEAISRGHPYGFHQLGTKESLAQIQQSHLLSHYHQLLNEGRLALTVVGDFDLDRVVQKIETLFRTREYHPPMKPILEQTLMEVPSAVEIRKPIQGEKAYLCYGFRGCAFTSRDRYVLEVLMTLLSSMGSGRLDQRLREEKGLVYSLDAFSFTGKLGGYMVLSANCSPDKVDETRLETQSVLKSIKDEKISASELDRVKRYIHGSLESDLQRSSVQASILSHGKLFQSLNTLEDYFRNIDSITVADIQEAANRYFNFERSVTVILSPNVN